MKSFFAALSTLAIASLFTLNQTAHAFPEMVRYGYVNCNSCHVSLTGAGVLNDYGREIAREKLALFKSSDDKSKEQLFAYGALSDATIAKYLKLGGDVRGVYYYIDNTNYNLGQTIFMQGDFEAAFVKDKWTVDGTLGVEQLTSGANLTFTSRRHYAQYALTDEFNLRAGKFVPAYGIRYSEHVFFTRDNLQFGDEFESYNLEASYITDQWNVFLTGVFGRYDNKEARQDRGATAQVTFSPTEKMKIGVNGWYGQQENGLNRWVTGAFGMFGLTSKLYASTEFDFQFLSSDLTSTHNSGVATTQKISYEVLEGLWAAFVQEYGKTAFMSPLTEAENYAIEFQIFPRSHFEFDLALETTRFMGDTDFSNNYWIVSHFYF